MKHLRQYIRNIIIEGMETTLPHGWVVFIYLAMDDSIRVGLLEEGDEIGAVHSHISSCGRNVLEVNESYAPEGYGPLLYDILLELAPLRGFDGVIPDRRYITHEASNVWKRYRYDGRVKSEAIPEDDYCTEWWQDEGDGYSPDVKNHGEFLEHLNSVYSKSNTQYIRQLLGTKQLFSNIPEVMALAGNIT